MVVVDPPRKGLNADAIEAIARMSPRRLVYISCDPATLARDIALLKNHGYKLKSAQALIYSPDVPTWRVWHCYPGIKNVKVRTILD